RHTPRKRSIQYAAAYRFNHARPWDTGSPAFAGDDSGHSFAISPRVRASFILNMPPSEIRGRRECRALDAPAASHATKKAYERSHHGHAGITRAFPAQWFTAYSVLSPVTGLFCHCRLRIATHRLGASVGASGPQGFAVP